jgi:tRNA(Arg) A34 adenosine deaminase TadA
VKAITPCVPLSIPAAHSEIVAIRNAWRRLGAWPLLAGSTLYSSCEPCLLCSFVITQIGFSRAVFAARGTDVPGIGLCLASTWQRWRRG